MNNRVGIKNNSTIGIKNNSTRISKRSFHTTKSLRFETEFILLHIYMMDLSHFGDLLHQAIRTVPEGLLDSTHIRNLSDFLSAPVVNGDLPEGTTLGRVWNLDTSSIEAEALKSYNSNYKPQNSLVLRKLESLLDKVQGELHEVQDKLYDLRNKPATLKGECDAFMEGALKKEAMRAQSTPMPTLGRNIEQLLKSTN